MSGIEQQTGVPLAGVWPSLLTPLNADGSIDHDTLAASVEDLVGHGVDGLVPLGTLGEFTEFDRAERRAVINTVVGAARGRVPVLAGVSALSTRETCRHADDAAVAGADAMLVLPPLYWKVDQDGMAAHFRAVAAATDRPVVLYDFPALTAAPVPASLVARLAADTTRIAGIKLTTRDARAIAAATTAARAERSDFAVFTGYEDLLAPAVALGADGTISGLANLVPDLVIELLAAARTDAPALPHLQRRVTELCDLYELANPAPVGIKAAAHALGRLPDPTARAATGLDGTAKQATRDRARDWVRRHRLLPDPAAPTPYCSSPPRTPRAVSGQQ